MTTPKPKQYKMNIIGNDPIIINEEDKVKYDDLVKLGHAKEIFLKQGTFKLSSIRGVIEIKQETFAPQDNFSKQEDEKFDKECQRLSSLSLHDKVVNELEMRIRPGLQLTHVVLSETQKAALKKGIIMFFQANPKYPRCPANQWWELIKGIAKERSTYSTKWFEYVFRNDEAVSFWAKTKGIKLNPVQFSMEDFVLDIPE